MKMIRYTVAIAALGLGGIAAAQSLEETYANLCSDKSAKQTEACTALRKALLEKLSAESGQPLQRAPAQLQPVAGPGATQVAASAVAAEFSPLTGFMEALATDQTAPDPRWGVFARLVGTQWAGKDLGDKTNPELPRVYRDFVSFSFLDDGGALEIQHGVELTKFAPARVIVLRPTSRAGVFDGEITQPQINRRWRTTFRTDERGAVVSDWYKVIDAGHGLREMHARVGYRLMPNGTMAIIGASGWDKDRPALTDPDDPKNAEYRLQPYGDAAIRKFVGEQIASYPDIIALEKQTEAMQAQLAQMQRERAARKASSGGLLGSLIGLAVGAAAGEAFGLNGSQTVGAMMKGMSITNPESPIAGALGSTGGQLLSGGGASSALTSGVGRAASGGGSYPTRPNLATGACAGFTEGNYRTKALEGGGDSQLNTMCGQAFEYYTMYKRAIAQGYSEADANRTYAAHEQSARVASGYLSSHGAN